MKYIIGCSGFHYKHWKDNFYPPDLPVKKWFEFYTQHFNTLELNVTFYRFPKLSTLQGWYDQSPADFTFSVKVPRSITQFKKLNGTARMVSDFYDLAREGLQEKLGCVLFQFPPNFSFNDEHLNRIIDSVDPSFRNVVEFRHSSWWNPDAISLLGDHGIAFCGMSYPNFPDEVIGNTSHLYYRMHGFEQLYASNYSAEQLSNVIDQINSMEHVQSAFVYFNNDVLGFATKNAESMIRLAST